MDIKLVALRPRRYARRDLVAGDTFTAPEVDALYLVRCKDAKQAPADNDSPTGQTTPAPASAYTRAGRGRQAPRPPTASRVGQGADAESGE